MTKCKICLENFDQLEHSLVPCINCDFDICRFCVLKLLLSKKKFKCIECKHDWDNKYLYVFFSEYLINTLIQQDSDCSVCAESFDDNAHSLVPCNTCNYEACKECIFTYIRSKQTPKCMQCNSVWNKEYLRFFFTDSCCDILIGNSSLPPRTTSLNRARTIETTRRLPVITTSGNRRVTTRNTRITTIIREITRNGH